MELAPRQVLKNVLNLYAKRGWKPVVAPEIEFYLVEPNTDPDYPLKPRSGAPAGPRSAASPIPSGGQRVRCLFEDIYDFSEAQGLEIDTLIHEDGAAQMEINLRHGDPLELADQVFLFKRTIREAALLHKIYATFMAKPIANEPGSALHIHHPWSRRKPGRTSSRTAMATRRRNSSPFSPGTRSICPRHVHPRALCEFVPAAERVTPWRPSMCSGVMTTAPPGLRVPPASPARGGWKTACPRRTPTPIW